MNTDAHIVQPINTPSDAPGVLFSEGTFTCDPDLFYGTHLSFAGDRVRISLKDGSVELKDITPDEAAKEFWAAIQRSFPKQP